MSLQQKDITPRFLFVWVGHAPAAPDIDSDKPHQQIWAFNTAARAHALQVADIMPESQTLGCRNNGTTYNPGSSRTFSLLHSTVFRQPQHHLMCVCISRHHRDAVGLACTSRAEPHSKAAFTSHIPVVMIPRKASRLHFRHNGSSKSCFAMLRVFRLDCSASTL